MSAASQSQPTRTSPENIEALNPGEVFVFGSNAEGQHIGGAARTAVEKFGAVMGQGEGLQGDSYAIPTMEGLQALQAAVIRFLAFAEATPGRTFLVTAIGTGIAGHAAEDIAPLFRDAPANVVLPDAFRPGVVVAYKGFNADMTCRGLRYEVGQTMLHTGPVKRCQSGLHACENPIDVFGYYPPSTSRFALVELAGAVSREENGDSKIAAAQLTVRAELKIPDLVAACIEWVTKLCNPATSNHATGYRSASSATGDRSASSATGDQSASSATGDRSASSVSGKGSVAMSIGYCSNSSADEGGAIVCVYRDDDWNLVHIRASKVGENGIKPNVAYTLDAAGQFLEVSA